MQGNKLILVVDDSQLNRTIATGMLQRQGFDVISASDGLEGVNVVKNSGRKPSLVLMDQQMPIMDGSEATKLIKEHDSNIPIVGLTTETDQSILQQFKESGLDDLYHKPIDPAIMQTIARKYSK
jgi:chemosensory pili system protein ChpA (sensor histidine kinase/response regulator)